MLSHIFLMDAKRFLLILNYLRNQAQIHSDMLPRYVRSLRELQLKYNFYELRHLTGTHCPKEDLVSATPQLNLGINIRGRTLLGPFVLQDHVFHA